MMICPACISAAAVVAASAASGGGFSALVRKLLRKKPATGQSFRKTNHKEEVWAK